MCFASIHSQRQKQWSGNGKQSQKVPGGVISKNSMKPKTWLSCGGVPKRKRQPWLRSTQLCEPSASAAHSRNILTPQQILRRRKRSTAAGSAQRLEESDTGSGARSVGSRTYRTSLGGTTRGTT